MSSKRLGIISLIGLLSVFAGCEIVLRIAGFGNPLIYQASASGYEIAPNQKVNRLGKKLTYNADGVRVADAKMPYAADRILTLGDSITYGGSQISDTDSYPLKLEAKMQAAGFEISVLNPSAGGWSLLNEAAWLKSHGTMEAKLIYLQIGENDLFQPFSGSEILDNHPSFPTKKPISAVVEVLTRYIAPRLGLGKTAVDPGASAFKSDAIALKASIGAIKDIAKRAHDNDAGLVIVYIQPRTPSSAVETIEAKDALLATCKDLNVPVIDVSPAMVRAGIDSVFRDNVHPNAIGNEVLAGLVASDAVQRIVKD
ncbi:SGNH/GDSL hydrolase family protein [Asticcacaulis sp. W401b]|uniref:SGNH/GDSL hydrolase family protein n=1 Tax=Asticcacaulis sp. W401b TaxID=3388666 RepID=UPI003970F046